jgi:hypothetical protein
MSFQTEVKEFLNECFGEAVASDKQNRSHRFFEEATELVQSCGMSKEECLMLVDYVYDRPVGELHQEIGGVKVTLAALCSAFNENMDECGLVELRRIWRKIDLIREKHKNKPKFSPLPK